MSPLNSQAFTWGGKDQTLEHPALSSDGKFVAALIGGAPVLIDLASGSVLKEFPLPEAENEWRSALEKFEKSSNSGIVIPEEERLKLHGAQPPKIAIKTKASLPFDPGYSIAVELEIGADRLTLLAPLARNDE